jgi:hypothetical protein
VRLEPKQRIIKIILFISFFGLNCVHYTRYIPNPRTDVKSWVENFRLQRSFNYEYKLKTTAVYGVAKGECVIGRGEHIKGVWDFAATRIKFEHIGLGNLEWTLKDGKWQEASRGEESDIFSQTIRVLSFDKFEYLPDEDGYWFRFRANVPFLSPKRWKDMVGFIKISKREYLPQIIWAGLPDSSCYWQIRISKYNKIRDIKPPKQQWMRYLVSPRIEGKKISVRDIKKRLDLIDIEYRIEKSPEGIVLGLPRNYEESKIETMLKPGKVEVFGVAEEKSQDVKIDYLRGDLNKPIFITKKYFDENGIKDASIKFGIPKRPYILISLNKRFDLPKKVCLKIDDVILGTTRLDRTEKIDKIKFLMDMEYYNLVVLRACLIQELPLMNIKKLESN